MAYSAALILLLLVRYCELNIKKFCPLAPASKVRICELNAIIQRKGGVCQPFGARFFNMPSLLNGGPAIPPETAADTRRAHHRHSFFKTAFCVETAGLPYRPILYEKSHEKRNVFHGSFYRFLTAKTISRSFRPVFWKGGQASRHGSIG